MAQALGSCVLAAEQEAKRRLAAIIAADVAGYSRLVGADEEGTLARWKAHWRELLEPKVAEYGGQVVRITGDGLLLQFTSAIAAVRYAVEVQCAMAERNAELPKERRIEFRMGINVGDIVIDGDDLWGVGVNIAARLESLADPGGICVSERVQEDVRGRLEISFEDKGAHQLKNIAYPVRIFCVRMNSNDSTRVVSERDNIRDAPSVMPFLGVPPRLPIFTGRSKELDRLDAILTQAKSAAVTQAVGRAAVPGLGGVGKTTLQ